ncbi:MULTISPECIES: hypothetical protein [Pseudomonas]|uniref:hypothetical protein n=1 Tax=Pseudomonas TaxID=286 RepID=UPI000B4DB4A5|nr:MULTISPECIES: hypothetical protein [Pseudomonas]AOA07276.1 hypothetical protein BFC21_16385 [Pseudomonas sp. TMW 2.1634]ASC87036.1 hypothetical protein CDA60_12100 [Pseudomonas fragi]NNB30492.1 hypothetical protein [Pseudomonas fragi]NNB60284.1 hypothetical protein [Pseudomonas fragi]PAA29180.1 hypothetical protein CJU73_10240 [Pseudomonas fragi]
MHGSELKDGQHSTPEEDPRPKLWPRVLGSLVIVGVMVGMMIGRLTAPTPVELQQVDVLPGGLVVWFSAEPKLHGELVDGTLGLLFDAKGKVQNGQLVFNGKSVNWRLRDTDGGLLLTLVAARALQGDWAGAPQDGRWRLQVNLRE